MLRLGVEIEVGWDEVVVVVEGEVGIKTAGRL